MAEQQEQQVRISINDRVEKATYANAYRTDATNDEVILDFGMNSSVQQVQDENDGGISGEIRFDVNDRIVMNYYTAKRLAITLGNLIHEHEENFGELKLNAADRLVNKDDASKG